MGSRADFYIKDSDGMKWAGSIWKKGEPWNIDINILVQTNKVEFIITLDEYLNSLDYSSQNKWIWDWPDSYMTDYSYIFDVELGKVIGYIASDKRIFDPIKIIQGEDLNSAQIEGDPNFPIIGENTYEKQFIN